MFPPLRPEIHEKKRIPVWQQVDSKRTWSNWPGFMTCLLAIGVGAYLFSLARSATGSKQIVLIGAACLTVFVALIWKVPQLQMGRTGLEEKDRLTLENSFRSTFAQTIGGIFFFVTAYFTWQQVEIARQSQINDRFTKAIDQLSAKDTKDVDAIPRHLAAIYSLDAIGRESPNEYWSTVEVLTAYVREKWPRTDVEVARNETPPELRAIIWVLLHGKTAQNSAGEHVDLHSCDLRYTSWVNAPLSWADLGSCNLLAANLEGADLRSTDLTWAQLKRARLRNANLAGSDLQGADLTLTDLSAVDLREVRGLTWPQLRAADSFDKAKLPSYLRESGLNPSN